MIYKRVRGGMEPTRRKGKRGGRAVQRN